MPDGHRVVVDASVMVELVTGGPRAAAAVEAIDDHDLEAPCHLHVEVLGAVHKLHQRGALDESQASAAIARLAVAPVTTHAVGVLLEESWSMRASTALYDAPYVALARRLGVPLVTADREQAAAAADARLVG